MFRVVYNLIPMMRNYVGRNSRIVFSKTPRIVGDVCVQAGKSPNGMLTMVTLCRTLHGDTWESPLDG